MRTWAARGGWWLVVGCLLTGGCGKDAPPLPVVPRWVAPESTLDFGEVPALNERTVSLPLVNAGRAPLRVVGVSVREADSPFRIISAPVEVPAQAESPVLLAFVPPRESPYTATLELHTDDPSRPSLDVSLRGEGRTSAILELDAERLEFGRVAEGDAVVRSFKVRSRGNAPLVLESLALVGDSIPSAFQLVGSTKTPAVLDVSSEVELSVRYAVPLGAASEEVSGGLLLRTTDPDHREARVALHGGVNLAPVPVMGAMGDSVPGGEVVLDATASTDADGDGPLTYEWVLRERPVGARAQVMEPGAARTVLRLDPVVPGAYVVELAVTDAAGARSPRPASARVLAVPAQRLLVDVSWDHAETDLDLHVSRGVDAVPGSVDDCHYANPRPDWGAPGLAEDPELLRDRLTGYGPEVFGYENPVAGTYRVAVVLARANGAVDPRSEATVRVYDRGVLKGEFRRTLASQGEVWTVADVQWPSGVVTEVP
ncbi:choice-of-anchor D domain-containing protein [Myxococcus sp. CA039A]|uniref:choice-of-anchor D domain-containing protein n=1 Tax=Myxococcus sp. CA039A TaxID=2741737 RepID=UPI00157AD4DE|nr:choice-of-anchor D domain-containing protein [Myxococcus sp. CA039A]